MVSAQYARRPMVTALLASKGWTTHYCGDNDGIPIVVMTAVVDDQGNVRIATIKDRIDNVQGPVIATERNSPPWGGLLTVVIVASLLPSSWSASVSSFPNRYGLGARDNTHRAAWLIPHHLVGTRASRTGPPQK